MEIDPEATRVAPPRLPGLAPGTVLRERFVLEEAIGEGGMSVVYQAIDRRREEANDRHDRIAIKVLGASFTDHPDAFVALQREARRAQTLAHPNIATVFDFDRHGDTPFLCMELLSGEGLDRLLQGATPITLEQAQNIIRGIADGLEYAHQRGIVHADLKPANIFLTDLSEVKLLDFGIARVIPNPSDAEATRFDAGQLGALTPPYASCEMFEGLPADPRDDVYALACVSYELLTGKHPFNRLPAPNARDADLAPTPVPELSTEQNTALLGGLAFDREARIGSARAFYCALFPPPTQDQSSRRGADRLVIGAAALVIASVAVWAYINPHLSTRLFSLSGSVGEPSSESLVPEIEAAYPNGEQAEGSPEENGGEIENNRVLDEPTRARIERILEMADLHRQMGKLITPPGTNAVEAYSEVIRLQPENARAIEGLVLIGATLASDATALDATGDRNSAMTLVDQALTLIPNHPDLLALKARWRQTEG